MSIKGFRLIVATLLALLGGSIHAQDFGFGAKAHGGASVITNAKKHVGHIDDKATMFNSLKISFGGGLYGEYNFMDYVGARLETLFDMVGSGHKSDNDSYSWTIGYLKIPVLAKIYPMGIDTGLSILVGPEVGFPLMKTLTGKVKDGDDWKELKEDEHPEYKALRDNFKKDVNSFSLGANLGIEYELPEVGVTFSLSGVYDITKAFKKDAKSVTEDNNVRLINTRLAVGYNLANLM